MSRAILAAIRRALTRLSRGNASLASAVVICLALSVQACTPFAVSYKQGRFTEYQLSAVNIGPGAIGPGAITFGPDGNLWFTEGYRQSIGRLTPSGALTTFVVPHLFPHDYHLRQNDIPTGITTGPDGNIWFTVGGPNETGVVGRLTPGGTLTQFPVPTHFPGLFGITVGPDGNLWFAETSGKLGRITLSGHITEYSLATPGHELDENPAFVTAGPDGNIWFTESSGNSVGRITPTGQVTRFPPDPTNSLLAGGPEDIVAGPDGNLWFSLNRGNRIARITPLGVITVFPLPTGNSGPSDIAVGPDGNLWFTEANASKLGRITTGGQISEFTVPTSRSNPLGITAGPGGKLWFTEEFGNRIASYAP
jgi:streptogramin lyase